MKQNTFCNKRLTLSLAISSCLLILSSNSHLTAASEQPPAASSSDQNPNFTYDEGILVLNGSNFQTALDTFDNLLVEFYATWCGHCQSFAPDYVKVAEQLKGQVVCAKVDTPEEHDLIEKYDILGFPTIKLFRKGKLPENYEKFRSVDQLVQWSLKKIGPVAKVLETIEEADEYKKSADIVAVAYLKDPTTYLEVADSLDDVAFAITHKEEVAKSLGFDKEAIKLLRNFEEHAAEYDGDLSSHLDIKKFIQASSLPLVVEFDQKIAQKIFGGDLKAHQLLFIGKKGSKYDAIYKEFKTSAQEFQSKVLHVIIDTDKDEHERIIEYFGIKKEELPSLRFIKLDEEMLKYKYPHDEFVANKISAFTRDVLDGKVKPHLLSQELPEDWDKEPVKVLVGSNFDEVAFNKSVNVLVEFYAPWCGHCKALKPIYEQLGEKYKDDPTIVIAKMDAASNELEHTKINSYPTIKLYKAETNEVVEFAAERTLEGLSQFIDSKGEYGMAAPDDISEESDEQEREDGQKADDKHDEL